MLGENLRVLLPYNERIYKVQGTKIKPGIKSRGEYLFKGFQQKFTYFTLLPECKKMETDNRKIIPFNCTKRIRGYNARNMV